MPRLAFAGLLLEWDAGELPSDPFAAALPLELEASPARSLTGERADLVMTTRLTALPVASPEALGATPVLFHGTTRCFRASNGELVLWDGASTVYVREGGSRVEAIVHASSLEPGKHFTTVTVTMAVLLALRDRGLFHLHAAAACFDDGESWLIPGESDAGKSTLALALFSAGARYVSDDAVLLRARGEEVEVWGLPRMLRVTSETAAAFPALAPLLAPCAPGSARELELDPRMAFPGRLVAVARAPRTIVFPSIGAEHTRITPLERAGAFGRLLHSCAWVASEHLPRPKAQLELLARLVAGARAYEVAVARAILTDPGAVVAELRARLG